MRNNYDLIAPYYDKLSRLIFFRSQLSVQIKQLSFIPAQSRILIVGGGTGWILEEIARIYPSGLNITYLERSSKMLDLSRKRDVKSNLVDYILASAEDFETILQYDVLITAFLFDNFSEEKIDAVFYKLHPALKSSGLWLFSDFYFHAESGKRWQSFLLKAMYCFFKAIANVEAAALVNTEHCFENKSYTILKTFHAYSGLIKSIIYQKP